MQRLVMIAAVSLSAGPAWAQAFDAAKAFGAREGIEQASLSPDGTKLAYIAPARGQASAVFVVPVDGSAAPKAIAASDGKPQRVSACRFDGAGVCEELAGVARRGATHADAQDLRCLVRQSATSF